MSWSEIKKAVNSDLNKPLDTLIKELLTDTAKETSVDEVESLLKNSTYGLSAIKKAIGSSSGGGMTPFYFTGFISSTNGSEWVSTDTLPYDFQNGSAVVYNNEIHILGSSYYSGNTNYHTKHYKWDGSSWAEVSNLPYTFYSGSSVVYNNEIHILGGGSINDHTKHYKWDGSSWTEVSTLPYKSSAGSTVVYNNEIHILGSSYGNSSNYYRKHYKWDGSSWTEVSTLPYSFYSGSSAVHNNEIHILGGTGGMTKHYKWDGSSWKSVSTLPYSFNGSAVVCDGVIHILGGNGSSVNTKHYMFKKLTWASVDSLKKSFTDGSTVVYDNEIQILGGSTNATQWYRRNRRLYNKQAILPSGVAIRIANIIPDSITTVSNCTKRPDGSILVDSDGMVEFYLAYNNTINYSIF